MVGGIGAALDLVREAGDLRRELLAKAGRFRGRLDALGFDTCGSTTQIVPVVAGENDAALGFAQALEERGVLGVAIRPPTVPEGTARVRFSLTAAHADEHVELALAAIEERRRLRIALTLRPPDRQYPPVQTVGDAAE